jgi:hypothetical protein
MSATTQKRVTELRAELRRLREDSATLAQRVREGCVRETALIVQGERATAHENIVAVQKKLNAVTEASKAPVRMLLWCPMCGARHVDAGVYATIPHHTHACQSCGVVWRPAIVPTVGVAFLPGFKDGVLEQ